MLPIRPSSTSNITKPVGESLGFNLNSEYTATSLSNNSVNNSSMNNNIQFENNKPLSDLVLINDSTIDNLITNTSTNQNNNNNISQSFVSNGSNQSILAPISTVHKQTIRVQPQQKINQPTSAPPTPPPQALTPSANEQSKLKQQIQQQQQQQQLLLLQQQQQQQQQSFLSNLFLYLGNNNGNIDQQQSANLVYSINQILAQINQTNNNPNYYTGLTIQQQQQLFLQNQRVNDANMSLIRNILQQQQQQQQQQQGSSLSSASSLLSTINNDQLNPNNGNVLLNNNNLNNLSGNVCTQVNYLINLNFFFTII